MYNIIFKRLNEELAVIGKEITFWRSHECTQLLIHLHLNK